MLRQFNPGTKRQTRIIPKVNTNNLNNIDLLESLTNIMSSSMPTANVFSSNTRSNPTLISVTNTPVSSDVTGSLYNIISSSMPVSNVFQSNTRSNLNPTKIVNNTNTINDFHTEILQYGARYVGRMVDTFDNELNTLTIYNVSLDYGTAGVSPENFEVLTHGLNIPSDYTIKEVGNNVVITLGSEYIDFENIDINDIYVIGKLIELNLDTEDYFDLRTEDDENIIL